MTDRTIAVPELGLVVLVGISGSGKSTFAARHFAPWQVVSSDYCRGLVSDDPNDQSATRDAFDVLGYIVGTRLRRGLLTVVDATSVQRPARESLVKLAREHDVLVDAIVLDVPERVARDRNQGRADRDFGDHFSAGLDRGGPKRNRARCTSPPAACTDWGRQALAACTVNRSGIAANVKYTGDPQVGQKARVFTLPLSPTMSQCAASPSSFTFLLSGKVDSSRARCRSCADSRGTGSRSALSVRQ